MMLLLAFPDEYRKHARRLSGRISAREDWHQGSRADADAWVHIRIWNDYDISDITSMEELATYSKQDMLALRGVGEVISDDLVSVVEEYKKQKQLGKE